MTFHIFGKLSSISLATRRPDYCHNCSQSRNHLNRTYLTKCSTPKDPQKPDLMTQSKEIQEQRRNKVIEISQSGKGHKAISKDVRLQRSPMRAIIHKWRQHGTVMKSVTFIKRFSQTSHKALYTKC